MKRKGTIRQGNKSEWWKRVCRLNGRKALRIEEWVECLWLQILQMAIAMASESALGRRFCWRRTACWTSSPFLGRCSRCQRAATQERSSLSSFLHWLSSPAMCDVRCDFLSPTLQYHAFVVKSNMLGPNFSSRLNASMTASFNPTVQNHFTRAIFDNGMTFALLVCRRFKVAMFNKKRTKRGAE